MSEIRIFFLTKKCTVLNLESCHFPASTEFMRSSWRRPIPVLSSRSKSDVPPRDVPLMTSLIWHQNDVLQDVQIKMSWFRCLQDVANKTGFFRWLVNFYGLAFLDALRKSYMRRKLETTAFIDWHFWLLCLRKNRTASI